MTAKTPLLSVVILSLTAVALAGCHAPADAELETFRYATTDYAFSGPAEMPAGWVRIVLENGGAEPHHIQLFRLEDGKTFADYEASLAANETHPEWLTAVGGPNTPGPGGESEAIVHLQEGVHVMVCEIPDAQGTPHVAHGMVQEVRVTDQENAAEPPEADLTVVLRDFSFEPVEEWTAGTHWIATPNEGGQPHELVVVRYDEGGNFSELLRALGPESTGPPPARFLGGVSGIAAGDTQYFPIELTPGEYGFVCFLEDPNSGAPHFALGMERSFTVS